MRLHVLLLVVATSLVQPAAWGQVPDHLKCYDLREDQAKVTFTADLGGLTPEPGCRIKTPARRLCVQTATTNVAPVPPGAVAGPEAGTFLCYSLSCPRDSIAPIEVRDQFARRTVRPRRARMLCAPASTFLVPCDAAAYPSCGGLCPPQEVCQPVRAPSGESSHDSCVCVPQDSACGTGGVPVPCIGACPPGQACSTGFSLSSTGSGFVACFGCGPPLP
jgi:hypothetical protein